MRRCSLRCIDPIPLTIDVGLEAPDVADRKDRMIPSLINLVGLPASASQNDIALAAERQFETLFRQAEHGDVTAQRGLVGLKSAYLVWAYRNRKAAE